MLAVSAKQSCGNISFTRLYPATVLHKYTLGYHTQPDVIHTHEVYMYICISFLLRGCKAQLLLLQYYATPRPFLGLISLSCLDLNLFNELVRLLFDAHGSGLR